MVSLYKVTAEINGVTREAEIVAKPNPDYMTYESRINKAFNLGKKDKITNVRFTLLKNYLGL